MKSVMFNEDLTLEQFIKFVPYSYCPDPLEKVMVFLKENHGNGVVVLNDEHQPLGVLSATVIGEQTTPAATVAECLQYLSPIITVSEDASIQALRPLLEQSDSNQKLVVVDHQGQLRGELDTEQILKRLLQQQQRSPSDTLTPLLDFLEKLPLPLMVQTGKGQQVFQNSNWQQKICSQTEQCCLLTVDAGTGKQWCNILSEPDTKTSEGSQQQNRFCPLFPLSTNAADRSHHHATGVWQFITLSLPESVFGSLWLVLATDISEHQQLCKELAAKNADLVQLNRLKDDFLACITHELKSPLTAIVGLSSLLNENSLGELNQRQQRYVNQIHQSGHQLMTLVNDLLDLARLETGQLQLHPEPVNLKQVCDCAYEQAQQQTPNANPPFTLEISPELETIVADEVRLRQMLVHLLTNARKFSADEGEMGLQVSPWQGWIAFTIWDTGIGIPEDSQHLIFQKFQQLEDPMTRQFSGTGLGLVLTQQLAHAHGGDVSFISTEGEGSQFTLLLPPSPADKSLRPQPVGKLVLVVESVADYVNQLTQQLQELGYQVAIARSGTEALLKARTFQPRLIFLNPVLPLLSGWDVLTLLKSHPNSRDIPVIVTATRAEKEKAMNNGADGFVTLPIERSSLEDALSICNAPRSLYRQSLTILRLNYSETDALPQPDPVTEILNLPPHHSSHYLNYRILEADDPEQADLLHRIWDPNVLLLTGENLPDWFIEQLSQQESLSKVPVVCVDPDTARKANQVGNLSVYPCFNIDPIHSPQTLWSVLHVAAGINAPARESVPYIAIADGNQLLNDSSKSQWFHAFVQYLETAGYRSYLANAWTDIHQQVQKNSVDLILLNLEGTEESTEIITQLKQFPFPTRVPIIVLVSSTEALAKQQQLVDLLHEMAAEIIPNNAYSMKQLTNHLEKQLNMPSVPNNAGQHNGS